MRFGLSVLLMVLHTIPSLSQGHVRTVSGLIVDDQNIAIPFANAALFSNEDSTLVAGAASDVDGEFAIRVRPGDYHLRISFLSYRDKVLPGISVDGRDVNVGTVTLEPDTRVLETVEIQGERSQMELQLDKRVFNVGTDLSTRGGNAADVLNNVPSVNVEVDGTVTLRGNQNVRILINGKPSGLTSRDPDALRNLQANLVERVEVITNPSSRYEASGEVGIINIVLKKNQQQGLHGTFTGVVGHPDYLGGSYSLNFRRDKVNVFSSYGMDYRSSPGFSKLYQRLDGSAQNGDTQETYQNGDRNRSELSHNLMGGVDFFIDDNSTLTGSIMYNWGDGLNKSILDYEDFLNGAPVGQSTRTDREREDEENLEAALNYTRKYKTEGQEFTVDFQYNKRLDGEHSDITERVNDQTALERSENIAVDRNWFVQSDYVHPFGADGKAEAGLRSSSRIVSNEFGLEELQGEDWIVLPAFNDNLRYDERIHAAYIMAGNKFNKTSIQVGIRAEYSDITTELTVSDEVNHREYLDFFPSVNLGFEVAKDKTIQLSYSKRINRPHFRQLLPFSNFADRRNFFQGNPNLNPEYTHSFEGGYLINWANGSLLTSAYYRHRMGDIQRVTRIDNPTQGDSVTRTRIFPVNVGSTDAFGLEANFSYTLGRWWDINTNANFFRAITEGTHEGEDLSADTYAFFARASSKIRFSKDFEFQQSLFYRGPRRTTQGRQLANWSLDLALAKDVLKGRGTITATVRDLFNTRKWRSITELIDQGYYAESESQWAPRQLRLTFTYRLNQAKKAERGRQQDNNGGEGGFDDL